MAAARELFEELQTQIMKVNIKSFFAMPMPTQPLGWFKKPITSDGRSEGPEVPHGGPRGRPVPGDGCVASRSFRAAKSCRRWSAASSTRFEFNNPTSDRRFGAQDVAKNYMLGSHHQATEYFEIMFNRGKFDALPSRAPGDPAICRRGGLVRQRVEGAWTTTRRTCRS